MEFTLLYSIALEDNIPDGQHSQIPSIQNVRQDYLTEKKTHADNRGIVGTPLTNAMLPNF